MLLVKAKIIFKSILKIFFLFSDSNNSIENIRHFVKERLDCFTLQNLVQLYKILAKHSNSTRSGQNLACIFNSLLKFRWNYSHLSLVKTFSFVLSLEKMTTTFMPIHWSPARLSHGKHRNIARAAPWPTEPAIPPTCVHSFAGHMIFQANGR